MLAGLLLAAALTIDHTPVDCVVRDQFARMETNVTPATQVVRVRLYFKADGPDWFFVPMTPQKGRYTARLPKPTADTEQVSYSISAEASDGTQSQTEELTADVVQDRKTCPKDGRVAEPASGADVKVFSTTPTTDKPQGFAGVSIVTAAGPREARVPVSAAKAQAESPASAPPAPATEYSIGSGDILRIVVYGQEALTQTVVVQPDGTFTFPLVGRVKASDMTPTELQRKLQILLAQDYIRSPQVTVDVQEYRSKTVFVVGEIAKPGTYPLDANTTVIAILAKAGPTTSSAGSEVVIVRPLVAVAGPLLPTDVAGESARATVLRVNLREIEAGALDKNALLLPNDTVFIPQAPTLFVTGEVRSPGSFSFKPGATVRQVVSLAGGFTERSSSRVRVIRQVDGKPKESKIQLDDPVLAGDIIVVKEKMF